MHYTQFVFYANTPSVNALKTIHFRSNAERDRFFDTTMSGSRVLDMKHEKFNMVRDRLNVRVDWDFDNGGEDASGQRVTNMMGVNYCYFYDTRSRKRYYCQVVRTTYINERVTEFALSVDILMTYFQGDFTSKIGNVHIRRQHITNKQYEDNLFQLSNKDRYITSDKQIIHHKFMPLGRSKIENDTHDENQGGKVHRISDDDMYLVFQCSADLSADFGDIDEPKMKTSSGGSYDKVVSPVDVYCTTIKNGLDLFKKLGDYPWISQNIKSINMIPKDFIDVNDLTNPITGKTLNVSGLYKLKSGSSQVVRFRGIEITYQFDEINELVSSMTGISDILKKEKHLFNSGYIRYYVTNWAGSSIELEPQKLSDASYNLTWSAQTIIGYDNKIVIRPLYYNSHGENLTTDKAYGEPVRNLAPRGEYLGASIVFNSWDTLPIMIDNYKMSLSSTAYQRKLTEESMMGNQIQNLLNGGGEDYTWWESAARVGGTLFGGSVQSASMGFTTGGPVGGLVAGAGNTLFNGFNYAMSEKDYYRKQKYDRAQQKLARPTDTNQNLGNAFAYANGVFGVSVKVYSVHEEDFVDALKYHRAVGYQWDKYEKPSSIMSMSHINYLEFDGEWYMDDIPTEFMKLAKDMFKQGVSFYHNPEGKINPFNDDVLKNNRVM